MPTLFLVLALPLQVAGAYILLRAGLRRAPGRWAAWLLLLVWVEAAGMVDKVVVEGIQTSRPGPQ